MKIRMQKNELRQMKAFMQKTKKDKLVMHISLNEFELEHYLLQTGKQPEGIFTIIIHKKR